MNNFLIPLLFVCPFSVALIILSRQELIDKTISKSLGGIYQLLSENNILCIVILYGVFVALTALRGAIKWYANKGKSLNRDDLHALLSILNNIVDSKGTRFLACAKKSISENWQHEKTFNEITKPKQQIGLLVNGVQGFFSYYASEKFDFRVGLMAILDKEPIKWFAFCPNDDPPKTRPDQLKAQSSTIMRALEHQGVVVVESIEDELKKKEHKNFLPGSRDGNSGSIITIPIYCPNTKEPIYTLSVYSNKNKYFRKKNTPLYNWILAHFIKRIVLEHHLMIMKEGVPRNEKK